MLIGDMLFVKKFAYGIPTPHIPWLEIPLIPGTDGHLVDGDKPQRGDIVIFRYPLNHKVHYVKRCVATGGDELFVQDKDLYLHHHEGNEYIKKTYDASQIIDIEGKLFVKNPYQKEHPGIHHDKTVTHESITIPAQTLVAKNAFIRLQGNDLYVNFPDKDMKKLYKENQMISFRSKLWVKNPKGFNFTKQEFIQAVNNTNIDPEERYFSYDVETNTQVFDYAPDGHPFKVPENEYFMMGDNRDHSADSRFWGTVPYGLVEGTPWFIYFSFADDYTIRWDRVGATVEELEKKITNK